MVESAGEKRGSDMHTPFTSRIGIPHFSHYTKIIEYGELWGKVGKGGEKCIFGVINPYFIGLLFKEQFYFVVCSSLIHGLMPVFISHIF